MVGLDVFDLDEALEDKNNVVKKKKISVNIKPPRHRFGVSLAGGWQYRHTNFNWPPSCQQ